MMMVIRMIKAWTDDAWNDYLYWYEQGNRATVKKINRLIKDIDRHPFEGIGKPEPLKHELQGKWSRRITQEDRLIYEIDSQEETVVIYSAKDHYWEDLKRRLFHPDREWRRRLLNECLDWWML